MKKRNFLQFAYEEFWVPLLGRGLSIFIKSIEGKDPKERPTFDLREK